MLKKLFITSLPLIVNTIHNYFYGFDKKPKPKKVTHHKVIDRTRFTQGMYDFAIMAYDEYLTNKQAKKGGIITQRELTNFLNETFDTNKSVTTMAHLYKGDIKRSTLATGHSYLTPAEKEVFK